MLLTPSTANKNKKTKQQQQQQKKQQTRFDIVHIFFIFALPHLSWGDAG
jgi:hypothetical protein